MTKEYQKFQRINDQSLYCLTVMCISTVFLFQSVQPINLECGSVTKSNTPLVLNGEQARRGDWPFIAALYLKPDKFYCGGTVISTKHVLTAAHCIELKQISVIHRAEDFAVRLGVHNLTATNEDGAKYVDVSKIHVHHDWNPYSDDFDADIAILLLSHTLTFNFYIQPICLPDDDVTIDDVEGRIVGWGYAENGKYQEIPRQNVTKSSISPSHCLSGEKIIAAISSLRTFCARKGGAVPNHGDSGGGFFVVSHSRWVQYGIMSVATANATGQITAESISVFTNVKLFKSWILGIIEWQIFDCLFEYFRNTYSCRLLNIRMKNDPLHLDSSSNKEGRTDDDVGAIYIPSVAMFVEGSRLGETFRNLNILEVTDPVFSEYKLHLSSTHFKDMEHLIEVKLKSNGECFLGNSFSNLSNLEKISLDFYKITVLHDAPFHTNLKLKEVYLRLADPAFIPKNLFEKNVLLKNVELDFMIRETNTKFRRASQETVEPKFLLWNLVANKSLLEKVALRFNTEIDGRTFETNAKLREVELKLSDVESLPWNLFKENFLLEKVALDFLITGIDGRTFETNAKLKEVSVQIFEYLPWNLLKNNSLLEKLYLYYQGEEIDGRTFDTNENLKVVELNLYQVKSLPSNLFNNNFLLEKVDLICKITEIDGHIFQTNTKLKEVSLELPLLEFIPWNLFKNNVLLEILMLDSRITEIDGRTFETNVNLKTMVWINNKRNIDKFLSLPKNMFKNNLLLERLMIIGGLKTIDEDIFETNVKLREISLDENNLEFLPKNLFKNNLLLEKIYVSKNKLKRIDVDFSLLDVNVLKKIILSKNVCTSDNYAYEDRMYISLIEFQRQIRSQCSSMTQDSHLTSSESTSCSVKNLSNLKMVILTTFIKCLFLFKGIPLK